MKIPLAIALASFCAVIRTPVSAETFNSAGRPVVVLSDRAPALDVQQIGFLGPLFQREKPENENQSKWKLGPKASGAASRRIRPDQPLIVGISGATGRVKPRRSCRRLALKMCHRPAKPKPISQKAISLYRVGGRTKNPI